MPKSPRASADPFGAKLLEVLRDKGQTDDLVYLAQVFGVKVQSTYDWITHGRMSRGRFQKLVEWSGRSLHWWFDIQTAAGWSAYAIAPDPAAPLVAEPVKSYHVWPTCWPFEGVAPDRFDALTERQKGRIEAAVLRELAAIETERVTNSARP